MIILHPAFIGFITVWYYNLSRIIMTDKLLFIFAVFLISVLELLFLRANEKKRMSRILKPLFADIYNHTGKLKSSIHGPFSFLFFRRKPKEVDYFKKLLDSPSFALELKEISNRSYKEMSAFNSAIKVLASINDNSVSDVFIMKCIRVVRSTIRKEMRFRIKGGSSQNIDSYLSIQNEVERGHLDKEIFDDILNEMTFLVSFVQVIINSDVKDEDLNICLSLMTRNSNEWRKALLNGGNTSVSIGSIVLRYWHTWERITHKRLTDDKCVDYVSNWPWARWFTYYSYVNNPIDDITEESITVSGGVSPNNKIDSSTTIPDGQY